MNGHVMCSCARENKIPKLVLEFVRSQRDKDGSHGSMSIAGADMPETRRQVGYQLNREKEAEDAKKIEEKKKLKAEKSAAKG